MEQENDSNENIYSDDSLSDTEPDNVEIDDVLATDSENENDAIPSPHMHNRFDDDGSENQLAVGKRPRLLSSSSSSLSSPKTSIGNVRKRLRDKHYIIQPKKSSLRCKGGHCWSSLSHRKKTARTPKRNIIHHIQSPINDAKTVCNPLETFCIFLTNDIFQLILDHTNEEINRKRTKYRIPNATQGSTCDEELKALIGCLILTAALKNNHLSTRESFNTNLCSPRYRAAMSSERFEFLVSCLRFDDKATREERKQTDPFAAVRELWEHFIDRCRTSYRPGSFITIDEQLLAFRGRSPFRMFIPNKPPKYGIKIIMACDSGTKYMVDASPYLGKGTKTNGLPLDSIM